MPEVVVSPILNTPYEQPTLHHALGEKGPTGEVLAGRRPSESFVPIPKVRKKGKQQGIDGEQMLNFDLTGERRERHDLVNSLRSEVDRWRTYGYPHVTPVSRNLLDYWSDPSKENKLFFCQREAVETAIFLAEVAGRHGYTDWRRILANTNEEYNVGLPRVALKLATGAGKTVVMAMLIAWQTLNKVHSPRDARFTKKFLVVTPGITIRDRLRVLDPSAPDNYYDARSIIPPQMRQLLSHAEVVVMNYHAFLPRDRREFQGVAAATKNILRAGLSTDDVQFQETPAEVATRVLRGFSDRTGIVVINDEAHHCYLNKIVTSDEITKIARAASLSKKELESVNEDARVWFKGLQAINDEIGIKTVYDLSATPFYLNGSGYNEGYLFPWVVSDFSLMDAIESGIVKVPRMPVDDDAQHDTVTYLNLWDNIDPPLPKTNSAKHQSIATWHMPDVLEGALHSLYRSYEQSFDRWRLELEDKGEAPPVFIVVCPNTVVSKLVYQWIAGAETNTVKSAQPFYNYTGNLPLFRNSEHGIPLASPRTILVDSQALESDEQLPPDFRTVAAEQVEAFRVEYRLRNPGASSEEIDDKTLLREILNTVGKPGKLGSEIRCVVSVAMLTEGWDANTVSHVLGVRPFRSQLLCEQVMGRGLRRRSYATDENGMFAVEQADVYGIPFAFINSEVPVGDPPPPPPATEVFAMEERRDLAISFPVLTGYRVEMPDAGFTLDPAKVNKFLVRISDVPSKVVTSDIVGTDEIQTFDAKSVRVQSLAYKLSKLTLDTFYPDEAGGSRYWHMPKLVSLAREWLEQVVIYRDGSVPGHLTLATGKMREAAESFHMALSQQSVEEQREFVLPTFSTTTPTLSTDSVYFVTRKKAIETTKSPISHVVLDGKDGNTWEAEMAAVLESSPLVESYTKNDHLGFTIPYVYKGRNHDYIPDFLVRLKPQSDGIARTLIVEVSGSQKSAGPSAMKAKTAKFQWCAAVNNAKSHGLWDYTEVRNMLDVDEVIEQSIRRLQQSSYPNTEEEMGS